MNEPDPQREQITRMLTDLANDPAAPPSTVDALTVIAAARAAAADEQQDRSAVDDAVAQSSTDPIPTDVLPFRRRRRRTALVALVAAASLAAIAALVIPLSLSGGTSSTTSADAGRAAAESAAGDLAAAPGQPTIPAAAPAPGISPSAAADAQTGPSKAAGSAAAAASAAAENAPADGFTGGTGCWPALSEPVAAALRAALPAGAFGDPQPLTGDCAAAPVGGGQLPGRRIPPVDASSTLAADSTGTAGTALVVRISHTDPGACLSREPTPGARCVPREDGTYLAVDGPAGPTAFAYGNGVEVAIGGSTDIGAASGLSGDQLATAARAVLGALG